MLCAVSGGMGVNMSISQLFVWLLYSSFAGSIAALFILSLRAAAGKKIGASWSYLIWFLLILRLMLPQMPESQFGALSAAGKALDMIYQGRGISAAIDGHTYAAVGGKQEEALSEKGKFTEDYPIDIKNGFVSGHIGYLCLIWLIGAVILSLYAVSINYLYYKRIKQGKTIHDGTILQVFHSCKEEMNVRKDIGLLQADNIKSPGLYGLFYPALVLPGHIQDKLSVEQLRYVILHELAHYRRKDIAVNSLIAILQIIHWFNPVIWYAFHKLHQDQELACDAAVLRYLESPERLKYGETIIILLEDFAGKAGAVPVAILLAGHGSLKKRIRGIAGYKPETRKKAVCLSVFFILSAFLLFPNGSGTAYAISGIGNDMAAVPRDAVYEDLGSYFDSYAGSFVLYDPVKKKTVIYNAVQSRKRISPYSTFKVIAALIGLENGIIPGSNTYMKWDGTVYPYKEWNMDQSLPTAMEYSVNWYFSNISEDIDPEAMKKNLESLDYGNMDVSGGMRDFWMASSLKISPLEQVGVFRKAFEGGALFSPRSIGIVKETIKQAVNAKGTLYGKTGTETVNNNSICGWFVGFVERDGMKYYFATNIQGTEGADGKTARDITLSILKDKEIFY